MKLVTTIVLASLVFCDSVHVYSSFWAPLFDSKLLNYRVDAKFDPASGRNARQVYETNHGYRGETLIAGLGSGKRPNNSAGIEHGYGDVTFYYT